jgi:hypothetical protein
MKAATRRAALPDEPPLAISGSLGMGAGRPTKNPDVEYLVFSGTRRVVGGSNTVATVGSWYAVRVEPTENGTRLHLLGKPNVGGTELCSDADATLADADYWCRDTRVDPSSPFCPLLTGREEVEVVRGVVTELREHTSKQTVRGHIAVKAKTTSR